jgi:hypothetical protein
MEACCIMLFHTVGALAKSMTVGFCFHLAVSSSRPLLAETPG